MTQARIQEIRDMLARRPAEPNSETLASWWLLSAGYIDMLLAELERRDAGTGLLEQAKKLFAHIETTTNAAQEQMETANRLAREQMQAAAATLAVGVYRERNRLVAALVRIAHQRWAHGITLEWRAGLGRHPEDDATWDREWMTIVFIDTPAGQLSWHIHDSELDLFDGIPPYEGVWDGHTTDEKYRRLELVR